MPLTGYDRDAEHVHFRPDPRWRRYLVVAQTTPCGGSGRPAMKTRPLEIDALPREAAAEAA
jgi:hypothetical protein